MRTKNRGIPPINFLRYLLKGQCPHCEESQTEFYDEGKTLQESDQLKAKGKVKPLWFCRLRPEIKGHISCTSEDWEHCPFH